VTSRRTLIAARLAREFFRQFGRRHAQHLGQMRVLRSRQLEFGRTRPQGLNRRTDRQQLAVAVGHLATMRGQGEVAVGHRIALAL
jgi:hypothetical protein